MSALTASVVQIEPCGRSPDMSMIPAPLMQVTSAHTSHEPLGLPVGAGSVGEPGEDPEPPFARQGSRGVFDGIAHGPDQRGSRAVVAVDRAAAEHPSHREGHYASDREPRAEGQCDGRHARSARSFALGGARRIVGLTGSDPCLGA